MKSHSCPHQKGMNSSRSGHHKNTTVNRTMCRILPVGNSAKQQSGSVTPSWVMKQDLSKMATIRLVFECQVFPPPSPLHVDFTNTVTVHSLTLNP